MEVASSSLKASCLLTLRYFGIFRYPLTLQEIHQFTGIRASIREVQRSLDELLTEAEIYQSGLFYMTENKEDWVEERRKGNERAHILLDKSRKYVSVISAFPFVRGIAISGSLSKYYASLNPDIDYFIITAANRLWIARSLLHLFKKLTFITGHQHYFCMNYFVDTESLKITHRNIYTAVEVDTLLPAYNLPILRQFFESNGWAREFLPNHPGMVNVNFLLEDKNHTFKKLLEWLIELIVPGRINQALMKLTDTKWRRKWKKAGYPEANYESAFHTTLHISKNHPDDYEKKVLKSLAQFQVSIISGI